MEGSDEAFIEQFATLSPGPTNSTPTPLPQAAVKTKDWFLCVLVWVITDRNVIESQFSATMMRAWGVHPQTIFATVAPNTFLIQFITEYDLLRVMYRGIWNYSTDALAPRRVYSQADLASPRGPNIEVWTQWHRIPPEAITKEGILALADTMGPTLSKVTEGFLSGNKYFRVKVILPINKPLKERLVVQHPTLGAINIYSVRKIKPYMSVLFQGWP